MSEDIHPDLESIMQEAVGNMVEESKEALFQDFKNLEQAMFDQNGDPDGTHEMWAAVMVASTADTTATFVADNPQMKVVNPVTPGEENGLLGLVKVGEGSDIYEPLNDPETAVAVSTIEDCVGVIIRCGGWAKPADADDDTRPSEHPDRVDSIITVMVTNSCLLSGYRRSDGNEEPMYQMTMFDGEKDIDELGQLPMSLIRFWHFPKHLKATKPELYDQIVAHVQSMDEDDE